MRNLKKNKAEPQSFITQSGSRKHKVLSPFYDGKKLTLMETGEIDTQDQINSHAPECDMSYILSRLNNGDFSVLNKQPAMYADFRNLPRNFREVLEVGLNAERVFNSLPVDVRRQFDNDYRQFVARAGSEEWNRIMHPVDPSSGDNQSVSEHEV